MGKGSSRTGNEKNKHRRFYTFTLSEENDNDKKLIEFLENRSTTASVKEGLKLLMEKQNSSNSDILQALTALSALNTGDNNFFDLLKQFNQNVQQSNQEQSSAKEKIEEKKEYNSVEQKKIKAGTSKALAALNNYKF